MLDGDFNLAQHHFAVVADGGAEGSDGWRRVEIKDAEKFLRHEIALCVQPAAEQQRIAGTDGGGAPKRHLGVVSIIFLQKRAVNDTENVILMIVPVFFREL